MKYECAVDEGVRIPMRDGVALVADVYRPLLDGRDAEPSPTILIRTCFNRKEVERYIVPAVCSRRPCGFFDDARAVRGPNADHSRGTAARPIRLRDRVDDSGSPVALDDGKHGSPESASE